MNRKIFTSEITAERYALFLRANLMVFTGYIIASIESVAAMYLGLTNLTYKMIIFICLPVIILSATFTIITCLKKKIQLWQELGIFAIYLITFLIAFYFWIIYLEELRFLGILNCLTAITVVLSYTNIIQSLLMSMSMFLCYLGVIWHSIKISGQAGSLIKETFLAFCILPVFFFIALAANYMNKKRTDLQEAKQDLEKLNENLSEAYDRLIKEQQMTEIEMELAGEIQRAIMPQKLLPSTDWDIAFMTKPYGTVSGDFYDFYYDSSSIRGISLFDVSGHGVAPALITILAKPLIYSCFKNNESSRLGTVFESSNCELMHELEEVNLYITGLLMRINNAEIEYINAGHPDILHLKAATGKVEIVDDPSIPVKRQPIGIMHPGMEYPSVKFTLYSGDFLVLYSDGLTETRNRDGELFGVKRLINTISSCPLNGASGMLKHINDTLESFAGDIKIADDITVIVVGKI